MNHEACNLVSAIQMPEWLREAEAAALGRVFASAEEQLRFTIELAAENVRRGTGGPFAAGIFRLADGALVAAGVNCVVPSAQSWAHAEMTAIAHAQNRLGTHHLAGCALVTSCEPCAMCYGATPWSGVQAMVYGAPGDFAREVGFDEGDKPADWEAALERRGIRTAGPMLLEEARVPFTLFAESGTLY